VALGTALREALLAAAVALVVSTLVGTILFWVVQPAPGLALRVIAEVLLLMAAVTIAITIVSCFVFRRYASERAIRVAMITLSDDERVVLRQVMNLGGEIRQDHIWRQLDFSKPKLSALVNNLERKGALTKTRYHRTNILKLTEEFGSR
jgi:uncharacterized membrane protein